MAAGFEPGKPPMRHAPIDPGLFVEHRRSLTALLPANALVVVHAADILPTTDGKVIYTSDRNQRVARWEQFAEGRRKRYEIEFPAKAPLVRLALSPGGTRLAANLFNGSMSGSIAIIEASSGRVQRLFEEDTCDVAFVSETQIATSGIRLWSME
jgi:hypothetical protein